MASFDLARSLERAARRVGAGGRRPRSDRGSSRLSAPAQRALAALTSGQDRPSMKSMLAELDRMCRHAAVAPPSRAAVYKYLDRVRTRERLVSDLPHAVQEALYNLEPASRVPEAQIAFYCFNYGGLSAMSYASAMPWLALYQARRMNGWRAKSRGVLEAVLKLRGI